MFYNVINHKPTSDLTLKNIVITRNIRVTWLPVKL